MYLGLLGCDWKTKWDVVAVQTGNLCRPGVGVEGSTVDKECMQIGGHSCVLVQTRLRVWQVEQAGGALPWWMYTFPQTPGRRGPSC